MKYTDIRNVVSMIRDRDYLGFVLILLVVPSILFGVLTNSTFYYTYAIPLILLAWILERSLYLFKDENSVFYEMKNEIMRRKQNPQYQIAVSEQSLKNRYPLMDNDKLFNALKRLNRNNLFAGYDSRVNEFYYMGSLDNNQNDSREPRITIIWLIV